MSLRIDYEPPMADPYGYEAEDALWMSTGAPVECDVYCQCPACLPELYDPAEQDAGRSNKAA